MLNTVMWGISEEIAKEALKVRSIKGAIKLQLQNELNNQCQSLCVRTLGEPSVLKDSSVEALESVKCGKIMREMKERAPDVLDFFSTVATPRLKNNVDDQVACICMVYSMMMNQRWQELSLVRKIATVILGVGRKSKKVRHDFNIIKNKALNSVVLFIRTITHHANVQTEMLATT